MKRVEPFAALLLPGSSALSGFGVLILALMLVLLPTPTRAQDSQFLFDATGNLLVQTAENSTPPEILGQPQNQIVAPGEAASFSVVVADTRGLTYQWKFNGTNIGGAMGDALALQNVGATNEGQYSVVLVNSSGSVTSAPAMLWWDGNGNGMPDSWEMMYFGNLNQTATGDYDHDGVANLQEFLDGTDPTNPASVRYSLTLLCDGGSVTVVPSQASYTNGQTVTLTASPPEAFNAWTGDIVTRNNPATLTITTNQIVFAHFLGVNINWTNVAGGDWNTTTNWDPNLVPSAIDITFITNNSPNITLNSNVDCGSLTFGAVSGSPSLTGSGTLTLYGMSSWANGAMSGTGRTVIAPGASLSIANAGALILTTRTVENAGTIVWTGGGLIEMSSGAVVTNDAGALLDAQNAAQFAYGSGTFCRFDNAGTFRKELNSGTATFGSGVPFNNYGTVDLQSGTLLCNDAFLNNGTVTLSPGTANWLAGGGSASGIFTVPATALVNWAGGAFTLNSGAQCNGSGSYQISVGTVTFNTDVPIQNLNVAGTLSGTGTVTVNNVMNWNNNGTLSGSGRTVIAPGATLNLTNGGTVLLNTRTLENGGTVLWANATTIGVFGGAVITNDAGALFDAQNAAGVSFYGGSTASRFDNAGTFRKELNPGTTTFDSRVPFDNYGTLDIQTGFVVANGGYTSSGGALLNCAIGGTTAGTGFGQLQVFGGVTLNGALSVGLTNGFLPVTNNSFTVLTVNSGSRSGAFSSFSYPSNQVTMQLSNTANSVIVLVTAVAPPPPQPFLLSPLLSGTNVLLTWTSVSNITYRVEFDPNLSPPNWTALPGDVTSLGNLASKLDPLTSSNRFYRVRVLP